MLRALAFLTIVGRPRAPSRHTFRWFAFVGAGLGAQVERARTSTAWRTRPTGWGHRWSGRGASS